MCVFDLSSVLYFSKCTDLNDTIASLCLCAVKNLLACPRLLVGLLSGDMALNETDPLCQACGEEGDRWPANMPVR